MVGFLRYVLTTSLLLGLVLAAAPAGAAKFLDLFTAIANNNLAGVKGLTPNGGTINAVDTSSGATPLTWACMRRIDPKIAEWFISRGASLEQKDGEGETPLTTATEYGNIGAVKLLLDKGADPNAPNSRGVPPIVLACGQHGQLDTVRALLDKGAKLSGKNAPMAVDLALAFKKDDIVKFLISKGARPGYFKAWRRLED